MERKQTVIWIQGTVQENLELGDLDRDDEVVRLVVGCLPLLSFRRCCWKAELLLDTDGLSKTLSVHRIACSRFGLQTYTLREWSEDLTAK